MYGGHAADGPRLDTCEMMDASRQSWTPMSTLVRETAAPAGVACNGCVYAIGGDITPRLTQVLDTALNVWQKKADLPVDCDWGPAAVVVKDLIYVVGGRSKACLCYNPRQDIWTTLSQPHVHHIYGAATELNGRIMVGGGRDVDYTSMDDVEVYDPANDNWRKMVLTLPKILHGHRMLALPLFE